MRSVALSGFLGTGKTTLAPLVATALNLPWVDTDQMLAQRHGLSVAELWRSQGEAVFREGEEALVRELLGDGTPRVIALGGGAVTVRAVRHLLLDQAFLVTLTAPPADLLLRLGDLTLRPTLLARDPLARIESLLAARADAYAECHLTVATDRLSPDEAVQAIVRGLKPGRVVVALGTRSYPVDVVREEPAALTGHLARLAPSSVVVVSDANVIATRGGALLAALAGVGVPVSTVVLAPGEEHKTLRSVEQIWNAALASIDRDAVVLGFGGGVVGDLAGFAAATLLRGVRVVHSPTTLLAMVDASVGGKTGFDVPDGKNLLGAFHQPSAVVVDLAHLATLSRRDARCGLAEIAKIALACDQELWCELEASAEDLLESPAPLARVVTRAIALKAVVVRDDEREAGRRAVLNLGHTLGHALEAASGYTALRHGEAVAMGLVAECRAAEQLGGSPPGLADRVAALLVRLGLPAVVDRTELARAWPLVAHDKKRRGQTVMLPVCEAVGACMPKAVPLDELARAMGLTALG